MLSFSLTILIICGGLGGVAYYFSSQAILDVVEEDMPDRAEDAAKLVARNVNANLEVLAAIADRKEIRGMDWEEQYPVLQEQAEQLGYIRLGVAAPDGYLRVVPEAVINIADREYFQQALGGCNVFTEPHISRLDQTLICTLAVPIYGEKDQVVGVLLASCDATILSQITKNIGFGHSGYAYVLDGKGNTIAHPQLQLALTGENSMRMARSNPDLLDLAALEKRMVNRETGVGTYTFEGVKKVMGFAPIKGTEWSIAVTAYESEVLAELNDMRTGIVVASILAILMGLLTAFLRGRQLGRPLLHAASKCQDMAGGKFDTWDSEEYNKRDDEIGVLFRGFDTINHNISRMIEELRQSEQRFKYMAEHDALTNLHNRYYLEMQLRKMEREKVIPVGVIVCDVDGLKMFNDTFGDKAGDELLLAVGAMLKSHTMPESTVARTSGDEFVLLLPGLGSVETEEIAHRIQESIQQYKEEHPEQPISLSMGYGVRLDPGTKMADVVNEAEQYMNHRKLFQHQSARSALVEIVMKAMEARDFITEGHTERLQGIVALMADDLGLRDHRKDALCLLARFHDIGKVGIPDHILFKPGRLSNEEYEEMKKHSEIGYRIARAAPDLVPIAEWILMHHEWWDGRGYPLGAQGEDIPIECRILAIADAFDAMISDRPYRKALSLQEAVEELERGAGTQFDPYLVGRFVQMM